jgi:sugar lactone lactonase YvrE
VTVGGDERSRQRQAALLDAAPYPKTMPAMTGLQVDAEGNVWVQEPQPRGEGDVQLWTVLAPDGAVRGTVRLPEDLRVAQIGADWIVALAFAADGGERVRLYRLRKPS